MSSLMWLPEIIRDRPTEPMVLRWLVAAPCEPPRSPDRAVPAALQLAGAHLVEATTGTWVALIPWRTLVYGIVRREVDERATVELLQDLDGWELRLSCLPLQTHAAHAAGAGGVAVLAAAAWLVGGFSGGLLPAAATALAGGVWADATRTLALGRLELRMRRMVEDLGLALWPDAPARLLPPPVRPSV